MISINIHFVNGENKNYNIEDYDIQNFMLYFECDKKNDIFILRSNTNKNEYIINRRNVCFIEVIEERKYDG